MSNNDGGPAFPHAVQHLQSTYTVPVPGMSLRDWFAGQALAGLLANSEGNREFKEADWARYAYKQADAMIATRNKQ